MDFISRTQEILDKHSNNAVIPVLQDVQNEFGYVPEEAVAHISSVTNINKSRLYGILTFYSQFYLKPRGKNIVKVCCGTACHVKGAEKNLTKLKELLKIKEGETTADGEFTLERIACMGACGLAPVVTVNQEVHGNVTSDKIDKIIKK